LAVLGLVSSLMGIAQDISGDWQGTLKAGAAELHGVLHITKDKDGGFHAILDSVDQGVLGIPLDSVKLEDAKVHIHSSALNGNYEGTLSSDGQSITGIWKQEEISLPVNLQRVAAKNAPGKGAGTAQN
jgi:uncharacterized protein